MILIEKTSKSSGVTPREVGGRGGELKNLNKDLYVIPNFYPVSYQGITIILIVINSNKISNNKQ